MFTITDEILIWAKKGNKRKVYRLKTDANVKKKFIELFNRGVAQLLYDEDGENRTHVQFVSHYAIINNDENFIINEFVLPEEIATAGDNIDTVENYKPIDSNGKTKCGFEIKAILMVRKTDDGDYIAGQKFTQRQIVVKQGRFNVILSGDTFKEDNNRFSISMNEGIDCLFTPEGLIFSKYNDANSIFDISDFYRSATQDEVNKFANSAAFEIQDFNDFNISVKSVPMRKKIAKILDLGTLQNVDLIRENAEKVDIAIPFNAAGDRIVLPTNKKELKEILAFLSEELYPGMFTNKTYLSNSTRELRQ